jgi:hypothetical protein
MGKVFSGFKNTMLVGKGDLPISSVTKIPQANDIIHVFNEQPSLTAQTTPDILGRDTFEILKDIESNSSLVKLDTEEKYGVEKIKQKYPPGFSGGVPVVEPEGALIVWDDLIGSTALG